MSILSRRVGVLLVVVVTLLVGSSVFAQGPLGDPFAQLSAKLDQILAKLSPAAPQPGPVTLRTGALLIGEPGNVHCNLTNLTSNELSVTFKGINSTGFAVTNFTVPIDPGVTSGFTASTPNPVRCDFSFVGFADDVRATLQATETISTNFLRTTAVLEARGTTVQIRQGGMRSDPSSTSPA